MDFKLLRYIVTNALFLSCLVAGGFYRISWAGNIISFVVVAMAIISILNFFAYEISVESTREILPLPVPPKFDIFYDSVCTCLMAAAGWYWLAGLYMAQAIVFYSIIFEAMKREGMHEHR